MEQQSRRLTRQDVFDVVIECMRQCRLEDPEHAGCGNPHGHACFIQALLYPADRSKLRHIPFCSACLQMAARHGDPGSCHDASKVSEALMAAGVPPEAGPLLGILQGVHDEVGEDWEADARQFGLAYKVVMPPPPEQEERVH